jgi:hypothetical protein
MNIFAKTLYNKDKFIYNTTISYEGAIAFSC